MVIIYDINIVNNNVIKNIVSVTKKYIFNPIKIIEIKMEGEMTAEESEFYICKGKRIAMEFVSIWLREHVEIAKKALEKGIDGVTVLEMNLESMEVLAKELDEKLSKGVQFISSRRKDL